MKNNIDYIYLKILIFIHNLIFLFAVIGSILIFFEKFKLIFSWFFVIVVICEGIFKSDCPLTLIGHKFREKLKLKKEKDFFVNRTLKKYFNFELSEKLVIGFLIIYFLISVYFLLI